jgi:hypothetical protein
MLAEVSSKMAEIMAIIVQENRISQLKRQLLSKKLM